MTIMTWSTSTHINDDDGNAVNNDINDNDDMGHLHTYHAPGDHELRR